MDEVYRCFMEGSRLRISSSSLLNVYRQNRQQNRKDDRFSSFLSELRQISKKTESYHDGYIQLLQKGVGTTIRLTQAFAKG